MGMGDFGIKLINFEGKTLQNGGKNFLKKIIQIFEIQGAS